MKKHLLKSILISTLLINTGCSAIMALSGSPRPNLTNVHIGQSKAIVESEPLKPINTKRLDNGNYVSTYKFQINNEKSFGRAVVYVILDGFTLFISEVITVPVEFLYTSKERRTIKVEYNPQGQVVSVF